MDHVPSDGLVADGKLHAAYAPGGIFHHCKGFGHDLEQSLLQIFEIFNLGEFCLPRGGLFPECLFRKRLQASFDFIDLRDQWLHPADFPLVFRSDNFFKNPVKHEKCPSLGNCQSTVERGKSKVPRPKDKLMGFCLLDFQRFSLMHSPRFAESQKTPLTAGPLPPRGRCP